MTPCIIAPQKPHPKGYVLLRRGGRNVLAHRYAWEQANGPIPDGMYVCHHCDVRACINLDHLFLGTPSDNEQDKLQKGRGRYAPWNNGKTHCIRGHEFTPENTRIDKRGHRVCRTCARERMRRVRLLP